MIISAHYDSVPGCPAADDNGSGVAGVLEAARVLALGAHDRTLVIACWDEEERGLIGSTAYAARARARAEDIKRSQFFADLRRSDHASFWDASFPAMMITDTANFRNTHYHCAAGPDSPDDLDPAFAAAVRATVGSAVELLKGS